MNIVDDLRELNSMHTPKEISEIGERAADEIEQLRKRIRRLDISVGFMVDKFAAQEGFNPNKLHDEIDAAIKEKE